MEIHIIKTPITYEHLKELTAANYGDMIKGVADIKQAIMALGGELHADAEALLLRKGSAQKDLWGFNIYPDKPAEERIEYTSFINIRPSQDNRAIEIESEELRSAVKKVIETLIEAPDA